MLFMDWSSDVCSSDLHPRRDRRPHHLRLLTRRRSPQRLSHQRRWRIHPMSAGWPASGHLGVRIADDVRVLDGGRLLVGGSPLTVLRLSPVAADLLHKGQLTVSSPTGAVLTERLLADRKSEEHTSELQSLMRISYAVFCLKKKNTTHNY